MSDATGLGYAVAAVVCAAVAVFTWRRRANSPTVAVALSLVMAGGCWWSVTLAVVATGGTAAGIATVANFPGADTLAAAFLCLGLAIARPQWVPGRRLVGGLLVEPVLTALAAVTNPWHLLVYRGLGAAQLTGPAGWTYGPLYWLDALYCYVLMVTGIALIAWGWWKASPAFRAPRLVLLIGALVPVVLSAVSSLGGAGRIPDLTLPVLALAGVVMSYAVARLELFTFSPVARALIVDQVGDAVVVISPGGRILDLNPAGIDLVRGLRPQSPTTLVGVLAGALFEDPVHNARETALVVDLPGGRAEFRVQASPLVDRRNRDLGCVYVARDVTEANVLSRRLAAAHAQLVGQVETIEALRADLVELASRDPLTGLHNRRYLVERFGALLAEAEASAGSLAVVVFDLDRFKQVNDEHGHLAGDAVLVAFAQRMARHSPADALVARWGGEEFFVALPGADVAAGFAYADDVRRRCAKDPIQVGTRSIRCTVSGGVASYPASGTTMDELFRAADVGLYEAKGAGRDVVGSYRHRGRDRGDAVTRL